MLVKITQISGEPFLVEYWKKDYLVLPPRYLPDIRKAGEGHLVLVDAIADLFFAYNWNEDLFKSNRLILAVVKGLNPQIRRYEVFVANVY